MQGRTQISSADILAFWFEEAGPKKWFNGGDAFDAEIRMRFEEYTLSTAAHLRNRGLHDLHDLQGADDDPSAAAQSYLALIIAMDQFPRNMYRGTKAAYAFDDLGLALAKLAVKQAYDLAVPMERRSFVYLPYMHSENLAMQDECVRLMDMRLENENSLFHARQHRKMIEKFGRFIQRNEILGRATTPQEQDYLNQGGYTP